MLRQIFQLRLAVFHEGPLCLGRGGEASAGVPSPSRLLLPGVVSLRRRRLGGKNRTKDSEQRQDVSVFPTTAAHNQRVADKPRREEKGGGVLDAPRTPKTTLPDLLTSDDYCTL